MTGPQTTLYPVPWTIERNKNTATVNDANRRPVPMLCDVELGWTDTTTGPYADPDSEFEELQRIVSAMNQHDSLLWLVRRAMGIRTRSAGWTKAELARSWEHWEKMAAEAVS